MAKSPDGRQVYRCPSCSGGQVKVQRTDKNGKTHTVSEDCKACDGSGYIVG